MKNLRKRMMRVLSLVLVFVMVACIIPQQTDYALVYQSVAYYENFELIYGDYASQVSTLADGTTEYIMYHYYTIYAGNGVELETNEKAVFYRTEKNGVVTKIQKKPVSTLGVNRVGLKLVSAGGEYFYIQTMSGKYLHSKST